MVSDTVVNEYIRAWKRSVFGVNQEWPSESIIAKIVKYMIRLDRSHVNTDHDDDGDIMADVVTKLKKLDYKAYQAFIAYHLAVVNDERHFDKTMRQRANLIGISDRTFRRRNKRAFNICGQLIGLKLARMSAQMV